MKRHVLAGIILVLFLSLAGLSAAVWIVEKDDSDMISDITIYLDQPILRDGGTVIVLPTEVDPDAWATQQGRDNPAERDKILDGVRPIGANDRRLGVVVSAPVSIVKFDFPKGGTFNFAFAPLDREKASDGEGRTKIVRNGRGSDVDPRTGERIEVPRIMTVHVFGDKATEERSLEQDSKAKFVAIDVHYRCSQFEHASACDATELVR